MVQDPSDSYLLFKGINTYPASITIKDINGALIHTEQIYSDSQAIDISSMASQLYFVQVEGQVMKLFVP